MPLSRLAAIDIGTNSFHLVIARVRGQRFETITREKQMVRLGHGGGDMKQLEPEAIRRGVAALSRMRQLAETAGAPVRAVATSAVREAENAADFIAAAARVGVDVEVISGLEEARLIHLGVLQAVPAFERPLLVVDIGGGSTEVLLGLRGETRAARSFKLGAVRLSDRFFPKGLVTPSAAAECRRFIRAALAPFEREVRQLGFEMAIASSGTAEAVTSIAHAQRGLEPLRTYNCAETSGDELDHVVSTLMDAPSPELRRSIPGLDANRADIIVAGALILQGVCETFGVERFVFSEYALREGVLLDTIERSRGGSLHHLGEVSRRSVQHLAERCDDDLAHSEHVARLALQLFDATGELHGLDSGCRDYLEAAARLANVGLVISHSKHHLHSYYVIRNSEDLTGFTDDEIEMIALVARYHRKSAPKPTHPEFAALDADAQNVVRVLAGLLRVAIGLDRSHDQRVRSLAATSDGRRLLVTVTPRRRSDNLELELYSAQERADLLEQVIGRRVEVTATR